MKLVLDASVLVKWLVPDAESESNLEQALSIMDGVGRGEIQLVEPVHWLAEVGAVLSRTNPETVDDDLQWLYAMELEVADDLATFRLACKLSVDLSHHLFDTLYHAVALGLDDATLVTADERYLTKARGIGRTCGLRDWPHFRELHVS